MMKTVNMHDAKTNLSKLVEQAAAGDSFVIAKAGKPMVRVSSLSAPLPGTTRRIGFLEGRISVPDDFDTMGVSEIEALFGINA